MMFCPQLKPIQPIGYVVIVIVSLGQITTPGQVGVPPRNNFIPFVFCPPRTNWNQFHPPGQVINLFCPFNSLHTAIVYTISVGN